MTLLQDPVIITDKDPPSTKEGSAVWWAKMIDKYGFTTIIAAFLIWFVTHTISGSVDAMKMTLDGHVNSMNSQQIEMRFYLSAICRNTAKTPEQLQACQQVR